MVWLRWLWSVKRESMLQAVHCVPAGILGEGACDSGTSLQVIRSTTRRELCTECKFQAAIHLKLLCIENLQSMSVYSFTVYPR